MPKVSKEQKAATRARLLAAAVETMGRKGYQAASMREIARAAEVGDATIYSYFPAKEQLLYAYFEDRIEVTLQRLRAESDFESYSFGERVQALLELHLEALQDDRAFVPEAMRLAYIAPLGRFGHAARAREAITGAVGEFIDAAVEAGEFERPPGHAAICALFWEYYLGIVLYWTQDTSDGFATTSQLIDQSLGLVVATLESGILPRLADLFLFFARHHMHGALDLLSQSLGRGPRHGDDHGRSQAG